MAVKQISVFIENRPGRLGAVASVLYKNGLDMRAMNIAEATDFGILRIIATDSYNTARVLQDEGYICSITDVIGAAIPDKPGSMCSLLSLLDENGINLEYTYAFVGRATDKAYVILRVPDADAVRTTELLRQHGAQLIDQNDLASM